MKRILSLALCFVLVAAVFAGCNPKTPDASTTLQSFTQSLTTSGYTFVTTTGPDGTTTVELVPPDVTTTTSTATTTVSTATTKPTVNSSTASSVQPITTQPVSSTVPGGTTTGGTTGTSGQFTSTVTVPMVTTEPEVLALSKYNLLFTSYGATWNLSDGSIAPNKITWVSQNEKVATVKNGVVTSVGMGTTRIYASYKDQTVYCTVTVQLPTTEPDYFLSLKYKTLTMNAGTSMSIYSGDIPQNQLTWTSSDTRIATVTNGTVVARQAGTAVITARYQNQTASCTITVQQVTTDPTTEPDVTITLTHSTLTLLVGGTMNIYNGNIPAAQVTWTTTNSQIVSVNNGVITALRAGNAVVKASYGGKSAMCTITVQQVTTDPTTGTTTGTTTTQTTTAAAHNTVAYTGRYIYTQLSSQEQSWYRAIDTAVNNLQDSVQLSGSFSNPLWYTIYFAYMFDNPEHFYLGAKVVYSSNGMLLFSYFDGTSKSYYNGTDKGDLDKLTETMRQNIRARKAAFNAAVDNIIATIPTNIPDVEKELMIYDRLLIDMSYNQSAVWDGMAEPNWNAYGALINHTGVCEAYSEAFQTLCYAVGINCTGVIGTANGVGHKWNAVLIGGDWYQCDVTFDDPVNGKPGVAQFHSYFNITSAKIESAGYSIADSDYPGPICTATKYSYKTYFG